MVKLDRRGDDLVDDRTIFPKVVPVISLEDVDVLFARNVLGPGQHA